MSKLAHYPSFIMEVLLWIALCASNIRVRTYLEIQFFQVWLVEVILEQGDLAYCMHVVCLPRIHVVEGLSWM